MTSIKNKLQWFLAIMFIVAGAYLLSFDAITIPSRGGAHPNNIEGIGVWLVAGLPLSFGMAMLVGLAFPKSPKIIGSTILALGFLSFFVGFFF